MQEYHPDDLKGKGEPSYSLELALKQRKRDGHRRVISDGNPAYEMTTRARPSSSSGQDVGGSTGTPAPYQDWQSDVRRRNTTGRSVGQGLKSKLGSLRRRNRS